MTLKEPLHFALRFLQNPRAIGALTPSGRALGRKMADVVDWEKARTVLEVGPGSGALTAEFLPRVQEGCRFFTVEINPDFVAFLESRFPEIEVVQDSVENLAPIMKNRRLGCADAIIAGLPWTIFTREQQDRYLKAIRAGLGPGGVLVTYTYLQGLSLPGGRRFLRRLKSNFTHVSRSRPVWANVPPAVFFTCRT